MKLATTLNSAGYQEVLLAPEDGENDEFCIRCGAIKPYHRGTCLCENTKNKLTPDERICECGRIAFRQNSYWKCRICEKERLLLIPSDEPIQEPNGTLKDARMESENMAYSNKIVTPEKKAYEPGPDDLGSLWLNKTKDGKDILSGTLVLNGTEIKVVGFPHIAKTEKGPKTVYNILKSKPMQVQ